MTFVKNFSSNRLVDKIKQKFSGITIIPVVRSTFNKVKGLEQIQRLCEPAFNSVLLLMQHKYVPVLFPVLIRFFSQIGTNPIKLSAMYDKC